MVDLTCCSENHKGERKNPITGARKRASWSAFFGPVSSAALPAFHITRLFSLLSKKSLSSYFFAQLAVMANVLSVLAKKRTTATTGAVVIALFYALCKIKKQFQQQYPANNKARTSGGSSSKRKQQRPKVGVNANFLKQMRQLLPICIPGCYCFPRCFVPSILVADLFLLRCLYKGSRSSFDVGDCAYRSYLAWYMASREERRMRHTE